MNRLWKVLKISAWIALFIVAVVYLQRYGIGPLREQAVLMTWASGHPWVCFCCGASASFFRRCPVRCIRCSHGRQSCSDSRWAYLTIILSDLVFCSSAFFIARRWGRGPVSRLVGASAMHNASTASPRTSWKATSFDDRAADDRAVRLSGAMPIGISLTPGKLFAPALVISVLISDSDPGSRGSRCRPGRKHHLRGRTRLVLISIIGACLHWRLLQGYSRTSRMHNRTPSHDPRAKDDLH